MSKEFIFELDNALYKEETGEAVFKPKVKGELVRCYKCVYWDRKTIRWDGKQNIAVCNKCYEWKGADFYCADGEQKDLHELARSYTRASGKDGEHE